jgi:hypothetical protein
MISEANLSAPAIQAARRFAPLILVAARLSRDLYDCESNHSYFTCYR